MSEPRHISLKSIRKEDIGRRVENVIGADFAAPTMKGIEKR
jgi:hypothetical protein